MANVAICVFGASTTWGAWDIEKGGWANRLRLYIDEKINMPEIDYFETYNLGVSGDTTEYLLERFEVETMAREPRIIIFSIGVNDAVYLKPENRNLVPIEKFELNIQKLSQLAKKFTEKIVFLGLSKVNESKTNPIPWRQELYYTNKNVKNYDDLLRKTCKENSVFCIDMFDLLNDEDFEDGLPPNYQGHEKVFQRVKNFLIQNNLLPLNA